MVKAGHLHVVPLNDLDVSHSYGNQSTDLLSDGTVLVDVPILKILSVHDPYCPLILGETCKVPSFGEGLLEFVEGYTLVIKMPSRAIHTHIFYKRLELLTNEDSEGIG